MEAALFAANEALPLSRLQKLFEEDQAPTRGELEAALADLERAYADRGVRLVATGGGYQFQTDPETNPWIQRLFHGRSPRLSRAVLETLAIIAYRQPATRAEIEDIRGVSLSSGVLKTLTERGWVRVVGRKEVPGRPSLYGTTPAFLSYFGLESLEDLPPLKEIPEGTADEWLERIGQEELPLSDEPGEEEPTEEAEPGDDE